MKGTFWDQCLGFPKNDVSYFDFSSLCVFYRPESLWTRTFTKYIDQTYMVKNFKNKSVIAQTW